MVALLTAALLSQKSEPLVVPAGTTQEFQETAYGALRKLADGEFANAAELARRLPKASVSYTWDDAKVPADDRKAYAKAREEAFAAWQDAMPGIEFKPAKPADIKFTFEPTIPPAEPGARNRGGVVFTSSDPAEPRIESVLAYRRDTPLTVSLPEDVRREVAFAVGTYFGLAPSSRGGGGMGRTDMSLRAPLAIAGYESRLATANMALATEILKSTAAKEARPFALPQARIQPAALNLGTVKQGDPVVANIEVANIGSGPLQVGATPDCTCLAVAAPGLLEPGKSGLVTVHFDTRNVFGPFGKKIWVYSNDPERAIHVVTVTANVVPRYRVLGAPSTVVLSNEGTKVNAYVTYDPERPFKLTEVALLGATAAVTFEPWEGELADGQIGEPVARRKGYKISMLVAKSQRAGRFPVVLRLTTDDPAYPLIQHGMSFQSGIVAMPVSLYFGEVDVLPVRGHVVVSRPGQLFHVTKVSSDSAYVKAEPVLLEGGDMKIDITVDKSAPIGRFSATVTVETDDPDQPKVSIPVSGIVN